jgi:transglutaminase/protease-like cytokinesis protein 3
VIVGDGLEKLTPVDAVKNKDFSGYRGNALTTLTEVRRFIDENNLLSTTLSDRDKITVIQKYLNATYSGKLSDDTYDGLISQVFLKGAGGCSSYATFFCFVCDCINIEVFYCGGGADIGDGVVGHAWNKVKADGKWYYIDTSWNAALNCFDYFLSETLWTGHLFEEEGYYESWGNPI